MYRVQVYVPVSECACVCVHQNRWLGYTSCSFKCRNNKVEKLKYTKELLNCIFDCKHTYNVRRKRVNERDDCNVCDEKLKMKRYEKENDPKNECNTHTQVLLRSLIAFVSGFPSS